jgi:hypothetical protein
MHAPESLPVDLASPADIREKLPEAEAILARMEEELREQQREIDRWRKLVDVLRSVAGAAEPANGAAPRTDPAPAPAPVPPPATRSAESEAERETESAQPQDLVVEVVNREVREIKSKDVQSILAGEGHVLKMDSVSNALWYAAEKSNLIQRTRRGWYAPRAFRALNLDSANGADTRDGAGQQLDPEGRTAPEGERADATPGGST